MHHPVYARELACAVKLAEQAGRAALAYYRQGTTVTFKANDGGPVTAADVAANKVLVTGLRQTFPQDAIVAEESPDTHAAGGRQQKERLWCIDPIDGTREFVDETGQFVVMVGLAVRGVATLGVVHAPLEQCSWVGVIDGVHAPLAEQRRLGMVTPLQVSGPRALSDARVVMSRHGPGRAVQDVCVRLGLTHLEVVGSVGLKMARLAQGQAELYLCATDRIHEWDTCGPEAILRAAGGQVTDLFGAPLRYNKDTTKTTGGMLASHGPIHAPVLASILELLPAHSPLRRAAGPAKAPESRRS